MVRACGGIEGNQIGEDARLCMGGKVRGKCGGSFESVSSHGDIEEASRLDRLHRRSLSASETHLDSFLKDGRKIHVGECALFQARNAPPFIGIIRRLMKCTEDSPKLCVNWLYRPTDLKLAKGILLDAAPNEVFYSFHKDVIPAASLLHLCKVAFLPKSVELPLGIPAFVCRRVYDITNKRLWWLTDQDYTNERQEEVDQLLNKTHLEMHTAVQSDGHSPKSLNNTTINQQLKSGSDNVQSSGTPTQSKGKKRLRNDQDMEPIKGDKGIEPMKFNQGIESIKRQHSSKLSDGGSVVTIKSENIKAEINKMADKGALVCTEGVENLVSLMQLDKKEKKIDLAARIMLTDVIAATEKSDFLHKFVQLKGVPVLDDWLREVHKGKNDNGSSPHESENLVEDVLLSLLRALEKLPINLNTLQTCNIGKSVNNLRSYKNLEIQKKARGLVDTWKKRVDAEMSKVNDGRSVGFGQPVSLSGKVGHSDVSQTQHKHTESTDGAAKLLNTRSSVSKLLTSKSGTLDSTKSIVPASVIVSSKDPQCKTVASSEGSVLPPVAVKEEKISVSNQSRSNNQSCFSDQSKLMSLQKEETRRSATEAMNTSKIGSNTNRNQRSSNGLPVTDIPGDWKEAHSGRSELVNKVVTADNELETGQTCQKPLNAPIGHGNISRLIVRLPNPGQRPGKSGSGVPVDDPLVMGSNQLPSGMSDKLDLNDGRMKQKSDLPLNHITTYENAVSCQGNEAEEGLVGNGEVSSPMGSDEEHRRNVEVTVNVADPATTAYLTSGSENGACSTEPRTINSYSSMHALVESCAKYSEAITPLVAGDDAGMNLLATVATGEISQFNIMTQIDSNGTPPAVEERCSRNDEFRLSCHDDMGQRNLQYHECVNANSEKQGKKVGNTFGIDLLQTEDAKLTSSSASDSQLQNNKLNGHQATQNAITCMSSLDNYNSMNVEEKPAVERINNAAYIPAEVEQGNRVGTASIEDEQTTDVQVSDTCTYTEPKFMSPLKDENTSLHDDYKKTEDNNGCTSDAKVDGKCDIDATNSDTKVEVPLVQEDMSSQIVEKVLSASISTESLQKAPSPDAVAENTDSIVSFPDGNIPSPMAINESKILCSDPTRINPMELSHEAKEDNSIPPHSTDESVVSAAISLDTAEIVRDLKEVNEDGPVGTANHEVTSTSKIKETENSVKSSRTSGFDAEAGEGGIASSVNCSSSSVTEHVVATRFELDLNEVIPAVEGNQDQHDISSTICSSANHLPSLSPFSSPISTDLPASFTVSLPAKGPFIPHEILLKTKGELGWKGSAATSAFRQAESKKISEVPDIIPSNGVGKKSHSLLNIDLNIPDEEVLQAPSQSSIQMMMTTTDYYSPSRTAAEADLDLNRVDETLENDHRLASTSGRLEMLLLPMQPASGGLPAGKANFLRNFDLNDRPDIDELSTEAVTRNQQDSRTVPNLSHVTCRRTNSKSGYTLPWCVPHSYPVVAVPSLLLDRGDKSNPVVATAEPLMIPGSLNGVNLCSNIYRSTSFSPSPATLVTPATSFPYANSSFPPSTFTLTPGSFSGGSTSYVDTSYGGGSCFPAYSSLFVAPSSAVSSNYPNPYMTSFPEGGTSTMSRQVFDLNTGPGSADTEGKDEKLLSASRQFLVATSQSFMEDQVRKNGLPTVGSKRKEPEESWGAESAAERSAKQVLWK
ncbi:uncharacterized protein LOC122031312 [Zingiber officinale]|uniref:BAH domain n=1 Tax=Zingiber officinale TaxID=94328 RepID=A0A8J5C3B9_ZINOF|nr:uncharacterized protein LOC122031312 [Zingiber officinale]KAG6470068.1 hypothetical protein ZIOFF_071120 [Zingiber officinale]